MKATRASKSVVWACGLAAVLATTACGRKKADQTAPSTAAGGGTVASSGGGAEPVANSTAGGVSTQSDSSSIGVTGSLMLSPELALDTSAADTVLAFPVVDDNPGTDLTAVIKAKVEADGTFSTKLPQGGQAWVLVTMASHAELTGIAQLVAQAESFKFIEMPVGKEGLLALPTSSAKGDLGLGQITSSGDDATASLPADSSSFSTDPKVLGELARTQKSLKFIRNIWMNTNVKTGEAYVATPYFSWTAQAASAANVFEVPGDEAYIGYGVGFRDVGGQAGTTTVALGSICDQTTATFTLTPPAALIPVDGKGNPLASVSTLDNANTSAAASDAADGGNQARMACNSQDTGFDAYSETGATGWNWSGNGYAGKVADGIWKLDLSGANVANFDMASATPLDANGKPIVYVPAINITSDADGLVKEIQIKMYRYDAIVGAFAEVTDLTAFKQLIDSSSLSVGLGFGGTTEGAMYVGSHGGLGSNKPLTLTGNVFSIAASALTNVWKVPGSAAGAGQIAADSIVVQYQMYGNTYRFDHK